MKTAGPQMYRVKHSWDHTDHATAKTHRTSHPTHSNPPVIKPTTTKGHHIHLQHIAPTEGPCNPPGNLQLPAPAETKMLGHAMCTDPWAGTTVSTALKQKKSQKGKTRYPKPAIAGDTQSITSHPADLRTLPDGGVRPVRVNAGM